MEDGVVELLTDGVLKFKKDVAIDAFLVGGGAGGGAGYTSVSYPYSAAGGGGGGYTKTLLNIVPRANTEYQVIIGSGGAGARTETVSVGGAGGATSAFGSSVNGGSALDSATYYPNGGNGGSGGGVGGREMSSRESYAAGDGGSDGSDGSSVSGNTYNPGTGQGTTTREFGEATGKLYAGGGGGGGIYKDKAYGTGGAGGGGRGGSTFYGKLATAGEANTGGGGGGGGGGKQGSSRYGANGGSGIVCIRLHKKNEEKLDFTYGGDYTVREDGVVELRSSSAITFPTEQKIDIFCVGGGGGGGWNPQYRDDPSSSISYGGGGGGRTTTRLNQVVSGGYQITIGSGGLHGIDGGATSFGNLCTAAGGDAAPSTR